MEYPAKLMVKYKADDVDFVIYDDFSNITVKMKKREENDSLQEEEARGCVSKCTDLRFKGSQKAKIL